MKITITITEITIRKILLSVLFFLAVHFILKQVDFDFIIHDTVHKDVVVELKTKVPIDQPIQLYYTQREKQQFTKDLMVNLDVKGSEEMQVLQFVMPKDTLIRRIRFDFGNMASYGCSIEHVKFIHYDRNYTITAEEFSKWFSANRHILDVKLKDNQLFFNTAGMDPFFRMKDNNSLPDIYNDISQYKPESNMELLLSIILSVLFFFYIIFRKDGKDKEENQGKLYSSVLAFIFCLLLAGPFIDKQLGITDGMKNTEKRLLARKSDFSIGKLFSYPAIYTEYFNDRFGFRKGLIFLNNYFKVKYLKTSPIPDKLIIGKENWLYSAESVRRFKSDVLYTDEQLATIAKNLVAKKLEIEQMGKKFYITIAPKKATVYPEYLPASVSKVNLVSKLDQVIEYLHKNTSIRVIDYREELMEAKKKYRIYYKHDTHWNTIGAFVGYNKIFKVISRDFKGLEPAPLSNYTLRNAKYFREEGDLELMLAISRVMEEPESDLFPKVAYKAREQKVDYDRYPKSTRIFKHPNARLPRLLMYRNSFAKALIPYFSEHFSRSVYLWTHKMNIYTIRKENPDIVILQISGPFIDDLLTI